MFGGILKRFATESYGISGTFCALALLCASGRPPATRTAAAQTDAAQITRHFITPSDLERMRTQATKRGWHEATQVRKTSKGHSKCRDDNDCRECREHVLSNHRQCPGALLDRR